MNRWCPHDDADLARGAEVFGEGFCVCGFDALSRRVEAMMRLLVDSGDATPAAQRAMLSMLVGHWWPDGPE